ncbi:hypothetical protein [Cellulomonas endometrii]|uniref:hypothetical protein n=1 Tax=Cellulomonas endometrii TaxID=3036301 RepID=UPI0024ACA0C2|nr:hypothetical protein [Cellulomonas endometrii]
MSTHVDTAALAGVAEALRSAGTRLDGAFATPPSATDAGVAAGLLASVLSTMGEAASYLTYEAHHIGDVADACVADYDATDAITSANLDVLAGSLG